MDNIIDQTIKSTPSDAAVLNKKIAKRLALHIGVKIGIAVLTVVAVDIVTRALDKAHEDKTTEEI